ncbi:MAG: glycosyltransferase family 4 protein [Polaribacter sp.]
MKKVLIIGPIQDFGGREIETNIIAKSLKNNYDVNIISTSYITDASQALKNLQLKANSLDKIIYKKHIIYRFLSFLSKIINRGTKDNYGYINNSISKKIGIQKKYFNVLKSTILKNDVIFICAQVSSNHIKNIIDLSKKHHKFILFRTTGTIKEIPKEDCNFLKKVDLFAHHSNFNAIKMVNQIKTNYIIIDQCSLKECQLLKIPKKIKKPLRFGYLGRLDKEKGILPLINLFSKRNDTLVIAGKGPLEEELKERTKTNKNCNFMGAIDNDKIDVFFEKIDVLIISSKEEAGPLVGIEAMAAGKIIISTKVGTMPERLESTKNNFWFDFNDFESLENQLNIVHKLKPEDLHKIGEELREKYISNYSFKQISSQYNNLLNL